MLEDLDSDNDMHELNWTLPIAFRLILLMELNVKEKIKHTKLPILAFNFKIVSLHEVEDLLLMCF